uniref:Uncharacterized protein n=1 Tax=Plectus sambesii TaxID=2011161 RepID=A0A914VJ98_9BILA
MEKSSSNRLCITVVAVVALAAFSSIATLFIASSFYPERVCGQVDVSSARLSFPKEEPQWDDTERFNIEEKGMTVVRLHSKNRCYLMPIASEETTAAGRPLELVNEPLSENVIEGMAGPDAVEFCRHQSTFLLRDPMQVEKARRKREADGAEAGHADAAAAPAAAPAAAAGAAGPAAPAPVAASHASEGAKPTAGKPGVGIFAHRPSGLDLPLEQREPRCVDLILDCGKGQGVGEVQTCYTWINGVIKMAQECVSPTQFKIYMTKPPGRMLKIAQQQWKICLQRRKEGLRC